MFGSVVTSMLPGGLGLNLCITFQKVIKLFLKSLSCTELCRSVSNDLRGTSLHTH